MEIISYRLVKKKHAHRVFDGEGARLYGGRWNSQGVPVLYTSDSLALCCLEIFVNLPSYDLLKEYVYIKLSFESDLVIDVELFDGWNVRPVSKVSQGVGDRWVKDRKSPVLRVPSVIIPDGNNYLLNFNHPDSMHIIIGEPLSINFDPGLKK